MRLKELRNKNGWSMEYLGNLIGVSDQTISNWEHQRNEPDIENLIKLADIFNVSIDYLLEKEDGEGLSILLMNAAHMDVDELKALVDNYLKDIKDKK